MSSRNRNRDRDSPYDDPLLSCCCCPCLLSPSFSRGIGRFFFVACYPFLKCFGFNPHPNINATHYD